MSEEEQKASAPPTSMDSKPSVTTSTKTVKPKNRPKKEGSTNTNQQKITKQPAPTTVPVVSKQTGMTESKHYTQQQLDSGRNKHLQVPEASHKQPRHRSTSSISSSTSVSSLPNASPTAASAFSASSSHSSTGTTAISSSTSKDKDILEEKGRVAKGVVKKGKQPHQKDVTSSECLASPSPIQSKKKHVSLDTLPSKTAEKLSQTALSSQSSRLPSASIPEGQLATTPSKELEGNSKVEETQTEKVNNVQQQRQRSSSISNSSSSSIAVRHSVTTSKNGRGNGGRSKSEKSRLSPVKDSTSADGTTSDMDKPRTRFSMEERRPSSVLLTDDGLEAEDIPEWYNDSTSGDGLSHMTRTRRSSDPSIQTYDGLHAQNSITDLLGLVPKCKMKPDSPVFQSRKQARASKKVSLQEQIPSSITHHQRHHRSSHQYQPAPQPSNQQYNLQHHSNTLSTDGTSNLTSYRRDLKVNTKNLSPSAIIGENFDRRHSSGGGGFSPPSSPYDTFSPDSLFTPSMSLSPHTPGSVSPVLTSPTSPSGHYDPPEDLDVDNNQNGPLIYRKMSRTRHHGNFNFRRNSQFGLQVLGNTECDSPVIHRRGGPISSGRQQGENESGNENSARIGAIGTPVRTSAAMSYSSYSRQFRTLSSLSSLSPTSPVLSDWTHTPESTEDAWGSFFGNTSMFAAFSHPESSSQQPVDIDTSLSPMSTLQQEYSLPLSPQDTFQSESSPGPWLQDELLESGIPAERTAPLGKKVKNEIGKTDSGSEGIKKSVRSATRRKYRSSSMITDIDIERDIPNRSLFSTSPPSSLFCTTPHPSPQQPSSHPAPTPMGNTSASSPVVPTSHTTSHPPGYSLF